MKILICHRPGGAFGYITDGWLNAIKAAGHECRRWDGNLDNWRSYDPDLYIGSSGHLGTQPVPNREQRGKCRLALHVNPYGPVRIDGINESGPSIQKVKNLSPDLVFGYGFETDRVYWSYWDRDGIPWFPMPTGLDDTIYKWKSQDAPRPVDYAYVGGRWAYKANTIDAYLIPLMRSAKNAGQNVAVYGWGSWPPDVHSGPIEDDAVCDLYNSAKIVPCISEPHTQSHGIDIPERVWKAIGCGALPVHDPVPVLRNVLIGIPMGPDYNGFLDTCSHYVRNHEARQFMVKELYDIVIQHHTYRARLNVLMRALQFPEL